MFSRSVLLFLDQRARKTYVLFGKKGVKKKKDAFSPSMIKYSDCFVRGYFMPILPQGVPAFNGDGYLPEGIYPCNEEGLYSRFVQPYVDSPSRQDIYEGFIRWRGDVGPLIEALTQWVDGSFVTDTGGPHDIDVVSFCDADHYNSLSEETQEEIDRLLDGQRSTQPDYSTHAILVLSAPEGHPDYADFELWRQHYRKELAKTYYIDPVYGRRILADQRKGFLAMTLGEELSAPVVSTERID